jgi:hypothetical protein
MQLDDRYQNAEYFTDAGLAEEEAGWEQLAHNLTADRSLLLPYGGTFYPHGF